MDSKIKRSKRVSGYVDEATKASLIKLAKSQEKKESELIGLFVESLLNKNPVPELPELATEDGEGNSVKFDFRLPSAAKSKLVRRAIEKDTKPAKYVRSLLMSHLNEEPAFTENELNVLRESNRHLAAIGRNINQISKAVNISKDNIFHVALVDLQTFGQEVEKHRTAIEDLVKANLRSWGASHG